MEASSRLGVIDRDDAGGADSSAGRSEPTRMRRRTRRRCGAVRERATLRSRRIRILLCCRATCQLAQISAEAVVTAVASRSGRCISTTNPAYGWAGPLGVRTRTAGSFSRGLRGLRGSCPSVRSCGTTRVRLSQPRFTSMCLFRPGAENPRNLRNPAHGSAATISSSNPRELPCPS